MSSRNGAGGWEDCEDCEGIKKEIKKRGKKEEKKEEVLLTVCR
jgi:hypothetical protein